MSIKRNILASYASQIYVTVASVAMVPLYVQYMGAEAYGLVGFFATLQACFNLLDMGLTPTIARESARFNGGAISLLEYRRLVRAFEGVFAIVALGGGILLFALAQPIATNWLNASQLPVTEVIHALQIMALIVALRWICGLYRGIISGSERLVWLSGFNSLIASVRFVLILPVLMFGSATPMAYFSFQLGVSLLELTGLAFVAYRMLPRLPKGECVRWQWAALKPVLKFSLSISFTSFVWILITQSDKLVLSKIMSLSDYGYFTVAMLLANGIMLVSVPISSVLMPRMSRLHAEGQNYRLIDVYRDSTRMVTMVAIPVAMLLAFFAPQLLWLWTGNTELVEKTSFTLSLYSIGYGFLAVGAFPYYLQYAIGDLKMHILGNIIFVAFLIPSMIWAVNKFGMSGGGWAWLASNVIYFLIWTPLVHKKFVPGIHWRWLINDVLTPVLPIGVVISLFFNFMSWSVDRKFLLFQFSFISLIVIFCQYFLIKKIQNQKKFLSAI